MTDIHANLHLVKTCGKSYTVLVHTKVPTLSKRRRHKVSFLTKNLFAIDNWWKRKISFLQRSVADVSSTLQGKARNTWPTATAKMTPFCLYVSCFFFCFIILCITDFGLVGIVFEGYFWKTQRTRSWLGKEVGILGEGKE